MQQVIDQTTRRVFDSETVPAPEKIVSLFEPYTAISRRVLDQYLDQHYGKDKSLFVGADGADVDVSRIVVCDLSDIAGNKWAHDPASGKVAIDPVLGRIAFPKADAVPKKVIVTFHYGFSADVGGGEYPRADSFTETTLPVQVKSPAKVQDALNSLGGSGVVEIEDSGRYEEALNIHATAGNHIELRAANESRPALVLKSDLQISGHAGAEVTLNGLLISGHSLQVGRSLTRVRLRHCTLVPGLTIRHN